MKPHLIIPMGGASSRFYNKGYIQPKPLIEIQEKPFLYWAAMSILKFTEVADLTFVVLRQHINEFQIDRVIKNHFPDAHIEIVENILPGPVFTSLRGVEGISDNAPIIFNDCDHIFKCSAVNEVFHSGSIDFDGGLLIFESSEPQFSYVVYDDKQKIIGTVEKKALSRHAICGAYIFRSAGLFRNIAERYIGECPYNECFMSGLYSVMCSRGMTVKEYLLDFHVEFGTPEEYEEAKNSPYFMEIDR